MKIAVTGGTGFVGRHLVNRLLKDNHEITVLTHRKSAENLFDKKVRLVSGSVNSAVEMSPAFQDADVVYHLVGIIAETRTKTFEKTVTQGTKNVIFACQQAGAKKIIYLSALGTNSDSTSRYFKSKYDAEQAIKSSGLNWTILRSSVIYGKQDGFLTLMTKLVTLSPIIPIFGDGKYKLQLVYIDDLTCAMTKTSTLTETNGQTIDIAGPEKLEYETIINQIKKSLNKKRMNIHIPFGVIFPVAALLEKIIKPGPITTDQLTMLKQGNTGDITKMKDMLLIEPVNFEQGLKLVFGEK